MENRKIAKKKAKTVKKKNGATKIAAAIFLWLFCISLFLSNKPVTVGHHIFYTIIIQILPALIGGVALALLIVRDRPKAWISTLKNKLVLLSTFLVGSFLSYWSLGFLADAGFSYLNYTAAKKQPIEIIILPVNYFHIGKIKYSTHKVYFDFEGKEESLETSIKNLRHYIAEQHIKNHICIKIRKGIWNHYLVENWEIVE